MDQRHQRTGSLGNHVEGHLEEFVIQELFHTFPHRDPCAKLYFKGGQCFQSTVLTDLWPPTISNKAIHPLLECFDWGAEDLSHSQFRWSMWSHCLQPTAALEKSPKLHTQEENTKEKRSNSSDPSSLLHPSICSWLIEPRHSSTPLCYFPIPLNSPIFPTNSILNIFSGLASTVFHCRDF